MSASNSAVLLFIDVVISLSIIVIDNGNVLATVSVYILVLASWLFVGLANPEILGFPNNCIIPVPNTLN